MASLEILEVLKRNKLIKTIHSPFSLKREASSILAVIHLSATRLKLRLSARSLMDLETCRLP